VETTPETPVKDPLVVRILGGLATFIMWGYIIIIGPWDWVRYLFIGMGMIVITVESLALVLKYRQWRHWREACNDELRLHLKMQEHGLKDEY